MAVNDNPGILQYTRIFKSPYFYGSRRHGVQKYSVYNHHYHPRYYRDPVEEYWQLLEGVTMWDVGGAERQVEITGPDAFEFTNMLTPRDLNKCDVEQCKYAFITNAQGGIINDPVLAAPRREPLLALPGRQRRAALGAGSRLQRGDGRRRSREPDVGPMQVQGPKSKEVMTDLFGEGILDVPYYYMVHRELDGMELVISRTGYSGELGYELYLKNASRDGLKLWDRVLAGRRAARDLPDRALPHPQDRGRHPGPRLRHVVRHQPLRGRLRLQVDGRAGAGPGLRRQGGPEEGQRGGREPQAGRRRDRGRQPRLLQRRLHDRLLPRPQERREDRQGHLGLLLPAPGEEHRVRHGARRVRRDRHRARGRAPGGDGLGRPWPTGSSSSRSTPSRR